MKKIAVLCLIVALAFGVTGATCMQNTQQAICNPPAAVITTANAVITFVRPKLNIWLPGSVAFNSYITAENIASGICVGVTELDALIAWLQSDEVKSLQTKTMVKAGSVKVVAPIDIQALIDWRDGVK